MTTQTTPTLPHDTRAEQAILGAMLLDPNAIPAVTDHTTPDDMYQPRHQTIMNTILTLWAEGKTPDAVMVAAELDTQGHTDHIGGATYIHTLLANASISANVDYHAQRVADQALLRRIHHAGQRCIQLTYTSDTPQNIADQAQQTLSTIERPTTHHPETIGTILPGVMDTIEALTHGDTNPGAPHPTGFHDLDDLLAGGLRGGQMVIIAARPGVGKSTLAVDIARHQTKNGSPTAIFSLEMSKQELAQRILSAEAEVRTSDLRQGQLEEGGWDSLARAVTALEETPLYIDDAPNLTLMEIRAKARRLHQQHTLGLIIVDYLQLLTSGRRVESRQQEVAEFSRQLKLLAKELDVPLIAISQLNRGVEMRGDDARPKLSDLRESGSLEQDADIVMLINRPDVSNRDHERAGEADIIVAKHRGGAIGDVTVAHQLQYSKFSNFVATSFN